LLKNRIINLIILLFLIISFSFSNLLIVSCTPVTNKNYRGKSSSTNKNYNRKNSSSKSNKKNNKVSTKVRNNRDFKVGDLDPYIEKYWGTRYKFGGTTSNGFDCSGFMCKIFNEAYSVKLPRNSKSQYSSGKYVSKSGLIYGDLVFFNTSGYGVSHVGVYIGNGKFAHASSSKGVTISRLDNVYYKSRYLGARRVLK